MAFAFYYVAIIILPLAFIVEFFTGYIKYKLHPLNIMGRIAGYFENFFYSISSGIFSGILFNISTILIICSLFLAISILTVNISVILFCLFSVFILASFLSSGGLRYESLKIYKLLKSNDINGARKNLRSLAGRDSDNLNASEIARAVIESVSENTGDGIGSVVFYFTVGLAAGLLIIKIFFSFIAYHSGSEFPEAVFIIFFAVLFSVFYKSVNLLDSLTGYRNDKYETFGKFSARLDDALNYIPFRITIFFMLLSTIILSFALNLSKKRLSKKHYHAKDAFKSWCKFRRNHPSPNGGQLESIIAGALNVKLGGVNYYGGVKSNRPVIGFEHYDSASVDDIAYAVKIMELTSTILIAFYSVVSIFILFYL